MIGIYKITCTKTSEVYIGSSVDLSSRKAGHFYRLRKGNHANPILQNKYNKYGRDCFVFDVLEEVEKASLIDKEQYYINKYKPSLNCNPIAGRPPDFYRSKEYRIKMSKSKKGKPHSNSRQYTKAGLKAVKQRAKALGKAQAGEKHSLAILSKDQVIQIKELIEENILQLEHIAKLYSVTYSAVADIKYNRSWQSLRKTKKVNARAKPRKLTEDERLSRSKIYNTYFND